MYVQMTEVPSYERAQENSNHPATAAFAGRLAQLCDGPAVSRNLEVLRDEAV
jgi:hypothetical protein